MPVPVQLTRFPGRLPEGEWSVTRRELIAASPERVWRALTEDAELERWWCDAAEVSARAGGRYTFRGPHVYGAPSDSPGEAVDAAGSQISEASQASEIRKLSDSSQHPEIIEIAPPARLVFRWPLFGVDTRVAYELANLLEATEITVLQTADRAPGWDPGSGPNWWWVALPSLRSHVERGKPDLRLDYAAARRKSEVALEVGFTTFPWIIWHKLTSPRELNRWWARKAEVELRPGGRFVLGLEGEGAREGSPSGPRALLEVEECRRLVHDWWWKDGVRGEVEWRIEETEEDVRVGIRDRGPWSPGMPRDFPLIYWASTLLSLKQMSERGVAPREYQNEHG